MTIRRLLSEANAAGFASLWLEVLRTNLRGKQFYEREGFALLGTRPFATDLAEIGIWVMARTTLASASV